MKTEVYKVVACWEPELTDQEWEHLGATFNILGTNDTHRPCGYFGSKECLRESLEPPAERSEVVSFLADIFDWGDQGKQPEYEGLKKLLGAAEKADPDAERLIIWNGR